MLVVLEHTLATLDSVRTAATQLIDAHASGKPLSPVTLEHYRQEFANLKQHQGKMRTLIARWWTLVEDERPG